MGGLASRGPAWCRGPENSTEALPSGSGGVNGYVLRFHKIPRLAGALAKPEYGQSRRTPEDF